MLRAAAILTLVMAVSVQAHAFEFQGVKWGTSLAAVQKKYPGGTIQHKVDGKTEYGVVREVAYRDAVVSFGFSQAGKLQSR